MNVEQLLDICSSQAIEISELKRDVLVIEESNANLQKVLEQKSLEIEKMLIDHSDLRKQDCDKCAFKVREDCSTQTVIDDFEKSARHLPVSEHDCSGTIQRFPEPSLFNHIFTPRSRQTPMQSTAMISTPTRFAI